MIVCNVNKTRDRYKTVRRVCFNKYAWEEHGRNLLPENLRGNSIDIFLDESSFNYFIDVIEDYYILTAYTRDKKSIYDAWKTSSGIALHFHEGGTHWHEFPKKLYICTFSGEFVGNTSVLLPERTCEEIKKAIDEYNTTFTNYHIGADLHYEQKVEEEKRVVPDYVPDFLFRIE